MEPHLAQRLQNYQQPQSLLSEGDDFVVIAAESSGSSPQQTPTPQESDSNSAAYQLSLACPVSSSTESEVQQMAKQISQVSEKQSGFHSNLKDNCGSLEQIRSLMSDRLSEMKRALADKDAELSARIEQCESLQASNRQMKSELARLQTREEEWQQTSRDYQSLKNQYGLLTNTKERLESEKAELQRSRDHAVAAETEKLQAKFDEERSAALEAERATWKQKLMDLQAEHAGAIRELKLELTGAHKECEAKLQAAQAEQEQELTSERERCRTEAERLLTEHTSTLEAMRKEFEEKSREQERRAEDEAGRLLTEHTSAREAMRKTFEEKIQEQGRLAEEARRELEECNSKHEAEKNDMLEMLKQFNVSSFSAEQPSSMGATVSTDTEGSVVCNNCKGLQDVRAVHQRQAVQEQGSTSSAASAPTVELAETSTCVSVATSDAAVATSVDMAQAAINAAQQTDLDLDRQTGHVGTVQPSDGNTATADNQTGSVEPPGAHVASRDLILTKTVESQTDPMEFDQVENSESLQKNTATRNLMMQLATFAQALAAERKKNEDLTNSLQQLQRESAELRAQLADSRAATSGSAAQRRGQLQGEEADALRKQLAEKQAELDSLLKDFDETRHTVYELNEKVKDYKSRIEHRAQNASSQAAVSDAQPRDQHDGGDRSGIQKLLADKQSELDSLLQDFDETRHKVYELNEKVKDYENRAQHYQRSGTRVADWGSAAPAQSSQRGEEAGVLRKQLAEKQSEVDSLIRDLDETRNKVYELNEKVKDFENRSTHNDANAEKLKQKIKDLESQAEIERTLANQLQMEIESARQGELFKATKIQAVENEAEQLRQEIRQLKSQEDKLNRECREDNETVQQVLAESDSLRKKLKELGEKCEMQVEVLSRNKQVLEEKANLEVKLRETIAELIDRHRRHADENDRKVMDEKRRYEQLYNKLCEQSDLRLKAEQQLKLVNQQLNQANQQLAQTRQQLAQSTNQLDQRTQQFNQTNDRLQESERFAADLQSYSDGLDKDIGSLKQQLQESCKKRDDVIQMAEQLRNRFQEELRKSADVESELQKLKLEHSKLRADYSEMERSATQMLAREHELNTQLVQLQEKLRLAEEAIGMYKDELHVKEDAIRHLKERVDTLLDTVASQEPQYASGNDVFNKHRTMRPPGGGNK